MSESSSVGARRYESPYDLDPARAVFANIPPERSPIDPTTIYNTAYSRYGNPEQQGTTDRRAPEESRATGLSSGTSYTLARQRARSAPAYRWPLKPLSGTPDTLTPPPKPPKYTLEINAEDVPSNRPTAEESAPPVTLENRVYVRPVPQVQRPASMNSVTTVSATVDAAVHDRPLSNATIDSTDYRIMTPLGSPGFPSGFQADLSRAIETRTQAVPVMGPDGRLQVQTYPSPPLQSNTSFDGSHQRYASAGSSSGSTETSFHEQGGPPTSHWQTANPAVQSGDSRNLYQATRGRSPRSNSGSQGSNSSEPRSPPPSYLPVSAKPRRRKDAYFAMANARSDQIMTPPSSTSYTNHPALRETRSASTSPRLANPPTFTQPPSFQSSNLPIRDARSNSVYTNASDDSIGRVLQPTQSAPVSLRATSPPQPSSSPFDIYRQSSSASDPPTEEGTSTQSSSSTDYQAYKDARSQSYQSLPQMKPAELSAGSVRRKPLPRNTSIDTSTDTFKETVLPTVPEPPDETAKEVVERAPGLGLRVDARVDPSSDPEVYRRSTVDSSKEFVPDTPVDPGPAARRQEPTSQAELYRLKNLERRQMGGRRRLRIANPDVRR